MNFLTTQPLWLAAFILIVPTTLLAMMGPLIARHYFTLSRLRSNNEVAGFKFATVGVLYAVLLAFAVVVVWEKFNQADSDVAKEAGAAASVFRLAVGLDTRHGFAIRQATGVYLKTAIAEDWPAMAKGAGSRAVTEALNEIYRVILKFRSSDVNANEALVLGEILRQVDRISDARRERLIVADGIVPGIIWMVLFSGAVLTIGFTFFFGTESLRAQVLMTGVLSILIFAGLLTIVTIDRPFAGTVKVGPEALSTVVQDFVEGQSQQ